MPNPFAYPKRKQTRRHGPRGYANYKEYRDWLRDEFSFRCVFCLKREQWDYRFGLWDIDHFIPQSIDYSSRLTYENLLYVCRTCNLIKSNNLVPDPCNVPFGMCLKVNNDGTITALNATGQILIDEFRLDNEDYTNYRRMIIETVRVLAKHEWSTLVLWMCYPDNLPDLSKLKPPGNSKPKGIKHSFYARRARGSLPNIY